MTVKVNLPEFASEAEEAQWWFDNREELGEEFAQAIREGVATQGTLARRVAVSKLDGANLRLDPSDLEKAETLAERKGVEVQTYLAELIHKALQQELEHTAA